MTRPLIVLFGNSITEQSFIEGGWGASLVHHFSRSADIVLRGYSGYNSRWALKMLDQVMDGVPRPLAAITVFFGSNDAAVPDGSSGFQHVLSTSGTYKQSAPLSRHPYGDESSEQPERTNELTGTFAKTCIDVAKKSGVPVIDIWSVLQHYPNWEKSLLRDGMHFTPEGHRILFEKVVELKKVGLSLEKFPVDLPLFSNLDQMIP